jgi:hypothetical protein
VTTSMVADRRSVVIIVASFVCKTSVGQQLCADICGTGCRIEMSRSCWPNAVSALIPHASFIHYGVWVAHNVTGGAGVGVRVGCRGGWGSRQ